MAEVRSFIICRLHSAEETGGEGRELRELQGSYRTAGPSTTIADCFLTDEDLTRSVEQSL